VTDASGNDDSVVIVLDSAIERELRRNTLVRNRSTFPGECKPRDRRARVASRMTISLRSFTCRDRRSAVRISSDPAMTDNTPPLEGLWGDEELELCPNCGRRRLVPRADKSLTYCLDCGMLRDDVPVVPPA
jgi:hypothetical protein